LGSKQFLSALATSITTEQLFNATVLLYSDHKNNLLIENADNFGITIILFIFVSYVDSLFAMFALQLILLLNINIVLSISIASSAQVSV
jgi:hypothetical protein